MDRVRGWVTAVVLQVKSTLWQGGLAGPGLPGAAWHFPLVGKAPLDGGSAAELEEIPHGGTQIDAGGLVAIGPGAFFAKNILPVVHLEGTDVLPLGEADPSFMVDGEPAPFADGYSVATVTFPEPGTDLGRLGPVGCPRAVRGWPGGASGVQRAG